MAHASGHANGAVLIGTFALMRHRKKRQREQFSLVLFYVQASMRLQRFSLELFFMLSLRRFSLAQEYAGGDALHGGGYGSMLYGESAAVNSVLIALTVWQIG